MNKEKKRIIATILLTGFILGCQSNRYIPDLSNQIEYHYKVTVIYNEDTIAFEYYNDKEQLIERIGYEYRIKYIYNTKGQLIEVFNCRMYNCQIGYRDILIYDDKGNYIEKYRIVGRHPDLDTVKSGQIRFYDENNRLTKELSDKGTDYYGKPYECWKYYMYEDDKIVTEITIYEKDTKDTSEISKYSYNKTGYLTSINRQKREIYQEETFEYDTLGNLKINTIGNSPTIFLYNEQGKLIEETKYDDNGEMYFKHIYIYEYKK